MNAETQILTGKKKPTCLVMHEDFFHAIIEENTRINKGAMSGTAGKGSRLLPNAIGSFLGYSVLPCPDRRIFFVYEII